VVRDEVAASAIFDDGRLAGLGLTTLLTFRWQADDPLAVSLTVTAEPDHPSLPRGEWVILRDFLRYGMEHPTGDGEVRMRPDAELDRMWFELARPGRAAPVSVDRAVVRDFLDRTEAIVPTGEESSAEVIDALVNRLLEGD
jgi:hypothetical protein